MQDFSGGGGNFKISCRDERAYVRGVWGHAPQENFKKMVQFRAF